MCKTYHGLKKFEYEKKKKQNIFQQFLNASICLLKTNIKCNKYIKATIVLYDK